jgi:hypothetical protein
MPAPRIQTAIPKRRYQLGPCQAVLLGEVESPDPVDYRFILAVLRPGENQPGLFVTAEANPRRARHEGSHRLRIVSEQLDEELGSSNDYANVDGFAAAALAAAAERLGLRDVTPVPLAG